jgi:hypothetical protein
MEPAQNEIDNVEENPELLTESNKVYEAFAGLIEEQGLKDVIKKAMEEHDELYIDAFNDKIFAYRPLYWEESLELMQTEGASEGTPNVADEKIGRTCVVAGLDNVVGKRAKAGVWAAIARKVMLVSAFETDLPDYVKLDAKQIVK